ncbi:MAG TPA: hypothetical protein VGG39_06105 [Polyangiaceae bacterium]|jgi:hypothetical protein
MKTNRTPTQNPKPGYLALSAYAAGGRRVFGIHMELSTLGVVSAILTLVAGIVLVIVHALH